MAENMKKSLLLKKKSRYREQRSTIRFITKCKNISDLYSGCRTQIEIPKAVPYVFVKRLKHWVNIRLLIEVALLPYFENNFCKTCQTIGSLNKDLTINKSNICVQI